MEQMKPLEANKSQEIFDNILVKRGLDPATMTAADAWEAFTEFAALPIDLVIDGDRDFIIYEYGIHSFSGSRMFGFTWHRIFTMFTKERDYNGSLAFLCGLLYEPTPELEALGSKSEDWHWDQGVADLGPMENWLQKMRQGPEWEILANLKPAAPDIYFTEV